MSKQGNYDENKLRDEEQEHLASESAIADNEAKIEAEHQQELAEQDELLQIISKARERKSDGSPMYSNVGLLGEILAKVKEHYEQKRLDRPKLREKRYHAIREILREVNSIRNFGMGTAYNKYVDQILALFPGIEEAEQKAYKRDVAWASKIDEETLDDKVYKAHEEELEEAKKQEG